MISFPASAVRTFAVLGLLLAAPAAAQTAAPQRPATFTLANGLDVVVIPDRRTPVVTQMIWYKVGSADETPGKSGLAHFLEHLMFKGTNAHPAGEFSQLVSRIGGNENAFTSYDYTGIPALPRDQLAVMAVEATDTGLVLLDENGLPERDVVPRNTHASQQSRRAAHRAIMARQLNIRTAAR